MMRCCWLIIVFPFFAQAQKFSTADLQRLKLYSTGSFSAADSTKKDSPVLKKHLQLQPIWQKRKDGIWMFAEEQDTTNRYQVWHYYIQDDSTLILQFLDFKDADKAIQLSKDIVIQQAKLNLYHLLTRHGCELYLKKEKLTYSGASMGKDCFTGINGIEYQSYSIIINKNTIAYREAGFDKNDKQVYGPLNNGYNYIKQAKSSK